MPLSNTTLEVLAGQPYWDDYNDAKGFHRILIRPRYPVQTRELNQIQSMLQNQVERLATAAFTEGQAVVGGEQSYANNVLALQLVRDDSVDIANFYNTETGEGAIVRGTTSKAEARVVQIARQSGEVYTAIIVAPLNNKTFSSSEQITVTKDTTVYTLTVAPSPLTTQPAAVYSVREGSFFLAGHLVNVPQQTVVVSSTSNNPSARIGFEITEEFITSEDDATLLDPALNSTNYAAPGAHRLKITATLATRTIDPENINLITQNASENFIEIARVGGVVLPANTNIQTEKAVESPAPLLITEDILAQRTYDESGDYVVRSFRVATKDHNPPTNIPNGIGNISGNTGSTLIVNTTPTYFQDQLAVGNVLIVNGERRAITAISSNVALTINSPFSVNFTNSVFSFADSDLMNVELESGKAYVRGYEFETVGTTKLTVPRARTTRSVEDKLLSTYFGPSVYVKRGNSFGNGTFVFSTTPRTDLHCVDFNQIQTNANAYASSRIGTSRVRTQTYVIGNGDANTLYRLYLVGAEFETKTYQVTASSNSDSSLTSVIATPSTKTVILRQNTIGVGTDVFVFPRANNALNGATVKFKSVYGESLYYDVVSSEYQTGTRSANLVLVMTSGGFMDRINALANVTVIFSDKCLRGITTSNTLSVGVTVANESRVGYLSVGNTVIDGTDQFSLVFKIGNEWVSPSSIKDELFSSVYQWSNVAVSSSDATYNYFTITTPTGVSFYPVTSGLGHLSFAVSNTSATIPLNAMVTTMSSPYTTAVLAIPKSVHTSGNVEITGKIQVVSNTALSATRRTKTFITGNTTDRVVSGGYLVSNVTGGQIAINNSTSLIANALFRVVGLGVPDAVTLKKVYAVINANSTITNTSAYIDVTDRYTLDTGQRAWCYDHAAIVLKPENIHYSANQMLVIVDLFTHTGTSGYFTANSYAGIAYEDIPTFTDTTTGKTVELRDCIDFRPARTTSTALANTAYAPYVGANQTFDNQLYYPNPEEFFQLDYAYYLGRVDKLILTADNPPRLKVLQGLSSDIPVPPANSDRSMELYVITYPPYTSNAELVQVEAVNHRRYTMRDIGRLEKRIERLEYYVQLSQLEDRTLANPELDEDDVERHKNGILIDSFASHAIANVLDDDYQASIDEEKRELRPAFVSQGLRLGNFESSNSTNVQISTPIITQLSETQPGRFVFPTYTSRTFIGQFKASKLTNINPFSTAVWKGRIHLNPSTDVWMDTVRDPSVSLNLFNENDNWNTRTYGTVWNDWQTIFAGQPQTESQRAAALGIVLPSGDGTSRSEWTDATIESYTTQADTVESRTGFTISAKSSVKQTDVGDRIIDTTIVPSMRAANIAFVASGLRPAASLVASFDDVDVTAYVERACEVRLASNDAAQTFIVGETITSNAANQGTAVIAAITGNTLRVVNAQGRFVGSTVENIHITAPLSLYRSTPHTPVSVSEYVSFSGQFQTSGSANTTYVYLDLGASAVNDAYTGNVLYITNGRGEGERATIQSYDGGTKIAVVSPPFSIAPTATSRYSIGQLSTDPLTTSLTGEMGYNAPVASSRTPGTAYGMFFLPGYGYITSYSSLLRNVTTRAINGVTFSKLNFPIGKRVFRLADTQAAINAKTSAETFYEVAGQTKVIENEVISTTGLDFITGQLSQTRGAELDVNLYRNPVAQTFRIDATAFPSGAYITAIDLFFGKADTENMPVTVQLRPCVNGRPSSDVVLATVEKNSVNVVPAGTTPTPTTSTHYTRFAFVNPVHLQGGMEYAVVVMTNSSNYELFTAKIGENIIGTDLRISEQPFVGAFFKSQNAGEWTPQFDEDMMFTLHRAVFSTSNATAVFNLLETPPTMRPFGGMKQLTTGTNGIYYYDLFNVDTGHIDFPETVNNTTYQIKITDAVTNLYQTTRDVKLAQNILLDSRARINPGNNYSVQFIANFKTDSDAIAPMYDTSRLTITAVKNIIDNGQLYSNGITIVNPGLVSGGSGSAYANTNTATVSITGTMASGATCGTGGVATLYINSSGYVENVYVTTNGSGYLETVTIGNAPAGVSWTTSPEFTYRSETSNKANIFGEQKARYITRRVVLADGFDAGDLKVYVSANRPTETNIDVYYKVLATGDKENFDDKNWVRMIIKDTQQNVFASSEREFKEYEYRTVGNTAAYTSNSVEYTRFNTFAIKVVMRSTTPTIVPRLRNLRALALDA